MVLTVRARPVAYERVPAVLHRDGTARIQIVRAEHDPFTYAYLKAMGRRLRIEASVNTSLNVGSPIAQTPVQALTVLRKAKALTGLLMLSAEGDAFMAWDTSDAAPKDGGQRLRRLMREWKALQAPVARTRAAVEPPPRLVTRCGSPRCGRTRWDEHTPRVPACPFCQCYGASAIEKNAPIAPWICGAVRKARAGPPSGHW